MALSFRRRNSRWLMAALALAGGPSGARAGDASYAEVPSVRVRVVLGPRPPWGEHPLSVAEVETIRFQPVGAPGSRPVRRIDLPRCGEPGRFEVGRLAVGAYDALILPWEVTQRIHVAEESTDLELLLPSPRRVPIEAVDGDGTVVPAATLAEGVSLSLALLAALRYDEGPRHRIGGAADLGPRRGRLEGGRGWVQAFPGERPFVAVVAPGCAVAWAEAEIPAAGTEVGPAVAVRLRKGAKVRALVRKEPRGKARPAQELMWTRSMDSSVFVRVPLDAEGRTSVLPLGPGWVRPGGFNDGDFRPVELASGAVVDL